MSKKNMIWCDQSLHQYDSEQFSSCPSCLAIENAVNNPDPDSINTFFKSGESFERSVDGLLFVDSSDSGETVSSLGTNHPSGNHDDEPLFEDVEIEFDQPFSINAVFELDSALDSSSQRSYEEADFILRGEPTESHLKEGSEMVPIVASSSRPDDNPETVTQFSDNSSLEFVVEPSANGNGQRERLDDRSSVNRASAPVNEPVQETGISREMVEAGDFVEFDSKEVLLDPAYGEMVRDLPARKIVGWIVVAEGAGQGESFNLYKGNNSIGRSLSANVSLYFGKNSDVKVSRNNQCDIEFNADTSTFTLTHGTSRNKTRLNGKTVVQPTELKPNDRIGVGRTVLMFIPLCGPSFSWDD